MSDKLPSVVSGPERASARARLIFWFSVALWIGFSALTVLMVPLLEALRPSLEAALFLSILVPGVLLLAANVAAAYPAFFAKSLRYRASSAIAWVLSLIVAVFGDLAFIWGIARLVIFGSSMP